MFSEPTNADRAEWAREALNVFAATTFSGTTFDEMMADWPTPEEALTGDGPDALGDLVCNLLHLAREVGLDPERVMLNAMQTFRDEEQDEELGDDDDCEAEEAA